MKTWIEEQFELYKEDYEFKTEALLLDINEQIVSWMQQEGITRSELAAKLGVSRAAITKLLGGKPNLTLKTLCKVATALGLEAQVQLGLPDVAEDVVVSFGRPIDAPDTSLIPDESALAA